MQNKIITPDAQPYNLYLNFDKVVVGLFILGFIYQRPKDCLNWTQTFSVLLRWLPFVIVAVVAMSLVTGYVRVEPKLIEGLWIWMWVNLLFTCMVEEAFFRGFIQAKLAGLLARHNYSKWIAPTIAAVLFGLTHFAGGGLYVVIAVFAGLGYGIIYTLTGRIEASIIAHFALNLTHMLFFTYPALQ